MMIHNIGMTILQEELITTMINQVNGGMLAIQLIIMPDTTTLSIMETGIMIMDIIHLMFMETLITVLLMAMIAQVSGGTPVIQLITTLVITIQIIIMSMITDLTMTT